MWEESGMADSQEVIRQLLEEAARDGDSASVNCDPHDGPVIFAMADEIASQVGSIATGKRDFASYLTVTFSRPPDGVGP